MAKKYSSQVKQFWRFGVTVTGIEVLVVVLLLAVETVDGVCSTSVLARLFLWMEAAVGVG